MVNGTEMPMEVDTGAAVSVISKATKQRYFTHAPLCKSSLKLTTYSGESLQVLVVMSVVVSYNDQTVENLDLYVVDKEGPSLFGREWLYRIQLDWKSIMWTGANDNVSKLLHKYRDVFSSQLGLVKSSEASLELKPNTRPNFCRARGVPFALQPRVEEELSRLVEAGILEKVLKSEWASPIVAVPKTDGTLCICGDFKKTVNPFLCVDQHPLPNPEELFAAVTDGKQFTKLDLSQAYQQLRLDEQSRQITTTIPIEGYIGTSAYLSD